VGGYWTQETETLALRQHTSEEIHIRLFTNSLNPSRLTALGSLATPTSGYLGYAPVVIGPNSWVVTSGNPYNYVSAPQVVWALQGSFGLAYGYYFTYVNCPACPAGGVERFSDGPYSMIRTGQQLSITPVLAVRGVSSFA
jgi:hypothetical protein